MKAGVFVTLVGVGRIHLRGRQRTWPRGRVGERQGLVTVSWFGNFRHCLRPALFGQSGHYHIIVRGAALICIMSAGGRGGRSRLWPCLWSIRLCQGIVHPAMCTVVVLVRPDHPYPLQLAANRDEHRSRRWDPPAAHWSDQPDVVAGRDRTANGTWMGVNRAGVVATILNRAGTLGPILGKRSRGELPLLALRQRTASEAADALTRIDAGEWRDFNMVIGDRNGAFFVRGVGEGHPTAHELSPGVSMVTAYDPNDPQSPRVARHLDRFLAALPEGPADWHIWRTLLSDRSGEIGEQMNVKPRGDYCTVSSSLLAISAAGRVTWWFAAGSPHEAEFQPVASSGIETGGLCAGNERGLTAR